jgi:hypothetical protein
MSLVPIKAALGRVSKSSKPSKGRSRTLDRCRSPPQMLHPSSEYRDAYQRARRLEARHSGSDLLSSTTEPEVPEPSLTEVVGGSTPGVAAHLADETSSVTMAAGPREKGRREGPLRSETRLKAAFLRKFRLACASSKRRKVTVRHSPLWPMDLS